MSTASLPTLQRGSPSFHGDESDSGTDSAGASATSSGLSGVCCIAGAGVYFPELPPGLTSRKLAVSIAPKELGKLQATGQLGKETVCVVLAHAGTGPDGRHVLLQEEKDLGPDKTVPTIEVLRQIRNLPVDGQPQEGETYTGPIWLFCCENLGFLKELQSDRHLLSQGYIILSGEGVLARTVAERNIADLGRYLASCRDNQSQPNHAHAFVAVLLDGAETAAIAGGNLEQPVVFHAPTTYEELQRNTRADHAVRLLSQKSEGTGTETAAFAGPGQKAIEQAWLVMASRSPLSEVGKLSSAHPYLLKKHGLAGLIGACSHGQCETAKWLIERGVLANCAQAQCYVVLDALCGGAWDPSRQPAVIELVDKLLGLARAAAGQAPAVQQSGWPLITASRHGRVGLVEHLQEKGISAAKALNPRGRTPLMVAAAAGHLKVLMFLCASAREATKLINRQDPLGNTALIHAVACRQSEIIPALLALGADPNQRNQARQTPLSCACTQGDLPMVKLLLQRGGIDLAWHRRALAGVCQRGRPGTAQARIEIARLLLENSFKSSELLIAKARKNGHGEIARMLESALVDH